MSWQVRPTAAGLWEVVAPSGQVAGLCPTRVAASDTLAGLRAFGEFTGREVAA